MSFFLLDQEPAPAFPVAESYGSLLNRNQILRLVYDAPFLALKATLAGDASGKHGSNLSPDLVWRTVFDAQRAALRVVIVAGVGRVGVCPIDAGQVLRDIYDVDMKALRVSTGNPNVSLSGIADENEVLRLAYSQADHALSIDAPQVGSLTWGKSMMDGNQILELVLNRDTGHLRMVG